MAVRAGRGGRAAEGAQNDDSQGYNEVGLVQEEYTTIEEPVLEKLRVLPPEKQKEVLEFVDSLRDKDASKKPPRSLLGLWADLNIHITEEDIAEARREMWGNFPRDIEL